jgi:hypothetical protein
MACCCAPVLTVVPFLLEQSQLLICFKSLAGPAEESAYECDVLHVVESTGVVRGHGDKLKEETSCGRAACPLPTEMSKCVVSMGAHWCKRDKHCGPGIGNAVLTDEL